MSKRESTLSNLEYYESKGVGERLMVGCDESEEFGEIEMGQNISHVVPAVGRVADWLLSTEDNENADNGDFKDEKKIIDEGKNINQKALKSPISSIDEKDPMDGDFVGIKETDPSILQIAAEMFNCSGMKTNTHNIDIPPGSEVAFKSLINWISQTSGTKYKVVHIKGPKYVVVKCAITDDPPLQTKLIENKTAKSTDNGTSCVIESEADDASVQESDYGEKVTYNNQKELMTTSNNNLINQLSKGVTIKRKNGKKGVIKYNLKNIGLGEKDIVKILSKDVNMDMKTFMTKILKKTGEFALVSRTYDLNLIE